MRPTLLDGPMGSELEARGVALPLPMWTAAGLVQAPDVVLAIHRDYAAAGADVHTTATFRTTARALAGTPWASRWEELCVRAVDLCRQAAGTRALVAGSLAPLEDCFHPERTPADDELAAEHGALARCLAGAGVDLLLVETMPTLRELTAATRAAAATGLPVWTALSLGPDGDFFSADEVCRAAVIAEQEGASAFLVNCTPADRITPLMARLADAGRGPARRGAYGNTLFGGPIAWTPERYAQEARAWRATGAEILGACCGTTPEHLRALGQLT